MFLNFVRKDFAEFPRGRASFQLIGKKSPAHEVAIAVYREERQPDHRVRARDLLRLTK